MATDINAGYVNNNNVIVVRAAGVSSQKLTDRSIDFDGDGNKEQITITYVSGDAVGTPSAPGGKINEIVTTPQGFRGTIIEQPLETDGGVTKNDATEFSEGIS